MFRYGAWRCCAYTSPIKCSINFGACRILGAGLDISSRRKGVKTWRNKTTGRE